MCAFSIHTGFGLEVLRFVKATAGLYPVEIIERRISAEVGFKAELPRIVSDINQSSAFNFDACMKMGEGGR